MTLIAGVWPASSVALSERSTRAGRTAPASAQRALLTDKPPIVAQLQLSGGSLVIEAPRPEPAWFYPTLSAFKRLAELAPGWDSYAGAAPHDKAIIGAMVAITNMLAQESAAPEVVPSSSGGVQLEWHRGGADLEILASSTGVLSAYYCRPSTGEEWEIERVTSNDLPRLAAAVSAL